ncbi:hypothetical protein CALVIDRAFT_61196 [Calocera viscosa TUFC12733]|uniref:Uncharacterized protein n=1 Tax=Calocera viscosa (strain TUFC12733) TaxID=1330018 RepID=A0A167NLI4_CALVF|nr:hypothetical protein CALVIDRAFT_61196 [Calocera viscosa TUFC12733]
MLLRRIQQRRPGSGCVQRLNEAERVRVALMPSIRTPPRFSGSRRIAQQFCGRPRVRTRLIHVAPFPCITTALVFLP